MNESSPSLLTRRDAVKVIGLGTAVASLGLSHLMAAAEEAAPLDPWALPKLPYGYTALEPHIDAHTMEIHHSKHHQAYINAAKKALEGHPEIMKLTPEQVLTGLATLQVTDALRTTLRNQVGGHVNHTFFWQSIAPGGGEPGGELLAAINKTFGSLDELKKQFGDAAMKRFGSGWAWLSVKQGALTVHSTANQDSPHLEGATPILGLDVWEHAYYLNYQNRRADYVKAYWNIVNWTEAGKRYVG